MSRTGRAGRRLRFGGMRLGFELGVRAVALLGRLQPGASLERHGVEVLRDVRYATGHPLQRLDVYRPKDRRGALPIVLYIHGGAFCTCSKETHWFVGLRLARRGYCVLNVSYRLAPREPFPAAIEDVCAAYAFAVEHAARLGGDPARIVVAGESAGANLASAVTVAACFRRPEPYARAVFERGIVPRATLPACGILQVSEGGRFRQRRPDLPSWIDEMIRGMERAYIGRLRAGQAALADPLLVLEGDAHPDRALPPHFIACGTRDPILDDSRRLAAALGRRGVAHDLVIEPGEGHAYQMLTWREAARRTWRETFRFLDRALAAPAREPAVAGV